jgi:hypothetical protein
VPGALFLAHDFGLSSSVDSGVRPYPGTHPPWLNTSIFLSGGRSQTEAEAGLPSTVRVRVSSRARMPIRDVRAEAFVLGPHVGVPTPAHAIVTLRSGRATIEPGSGSSTETDPRVLTCGVVDTDAGGGGEPRPWTPTEQQLRAGAGQLCLSANCYADGDGAAAAADEPIAPDTDPHHGQRNLLLLTAPSFRGILTSFLVLPAPWAQPSRLDLVPLHTGALDAGERWLLGSHPAVTVVGSRPGRRRRTVRGADGQLCPIQTAQRPLGGQLAVAGARPGATVLLPGFGEPRVAELQLPAPGADRPGTLHAVDIVQRDGRNRVLGGLRVLALITA